METLKNILGAIDDEVERCKKELDDRYSTAALETENETLKARLTGVANKLKEDLTTLAAELPTDVVTLYEKGARVWRTKAIDPDRMPVEFRWGSFNLFYDGQVEFHLRDGLWRFLVVAIPVTPDEELSEFDRQGLPPKRDC